MKLKCNAGMQSLADGTGVQWAARLKEIDTLPWNEARKDASQLGHLEST